jgi:hypothetical protein
MLRALNFKGLRGHLPPEKLQAIEADIARVECSLQKRGENKTKHQRTDPLNVRRRSLPKIRYDHPSFTEDVVTAALLDFDGRANEHGTYVMQRALCFWCILYQHGIPAVAAPTAHQFPRMNQ